MNESHHQTPTCAITETHHQTPISATETHHQTSIQPLSNHATHHRSTQTLICAITKTPPLTPITTNPPLPPRRSTNSDLHHADPYKPTPSTSPWQVGNTICIETHQKKKKKMPKRETHWFERGAWGIWIWVWVWAKSRDKESSRRLSIKIKGERRKRRRKKEEKERMEAEKLRDWFGEEKEKERRKQKRKRNPQALLRQESFRELWSEIVVFWSVLGLIFCF